MKFSAFIHFASLLVAANAHLIHPLHPRQDGNSTELSITSARSTTRWVNCDSCDGHVQIIDVILNNTGSSTWLTVDQNLQITIEADELETVQPAVVKRLKPGDAAIVEVGVQNADGSDSEWTGSANAIAQWSGGQSTSLEFQGTFGLPSYSADVDSIDRHESPEWFRGAKFGIFIHWGLYSVPAYNSEWYWYHQRNDSPDDSFDTFNYHLETYGSDFLYDDFIANFTADNYDPKAWVDLVNDAGARYFVPTTKHHEGFALFDMPSNVSNRNSVALTPNRDLIKELFDAATEYQPQLHRGTYFSIPEFFNPLFTEYGDGNTWGIGPPMNSYTGEEVPYTGLVEVDDFLSGVQLPQMNILAYEYDTEIMWCDIGGASLSDEFAADWFNYAFSQDKQVTFNDRCGSLPGREIKGDYSTPENAESPDFSPDHWEVCRHMDPYAWGYIAGTPDDEYMDTSTIVTTLVDVVSKNGNLLLNVGPRADGTIADVMQTNLRGAGEWLATHGESIYDTKYWPSAQGTDNVRYTTTDDAFYIHSLTEPEESFTVPDEVPYMSGDTVTVVGGTMNGTVLDSQLDGNTLVLKIPDDVTAADQYVWTFKIEY